MPLADTLRPAARRGLRLARFFAFLPPALTRAILVWGFYVRGIGMLSHLDTTTILFSALGIPFPRASAAILGLLEVAGAALLALGLFTRLVGLTLGVTMGIALATADKERLLASWDLVSGLQPSDISSLVFLILLFWLVTHGPGPLSVDWFLGRWLQRPRGGTVG